MNGLQYSQDFRIGESTEMFSKILVGLGFLYGKPLFACTPYAMIAKAIDTRVKNVIFRVLRRRQVTNMSGDFFS